MVILDHQFICVNVAKTFVDGESEKFTEIEYAPFRSLVFYLFLLAGLNLRSLDEAELSKTPA